MKEEMKEKIQAIIRSVEAIQPDDSWGDRCREEALEMLWELLEEE